MRLMPLRRGLLLSMFIAAAIGAVFLVRPYARGLSLVIRAAELGGRLQAVAEIGSAQVDRHELRIPVAGGTLRARAYMPRGGAARSALLVTGLHPAGIDEPRLMRLAQQVAGSGVGIVTPEIPELMQFAITPAITDAIEQSAEWLTTEREFAPDGRIGMMGVSFSGGLTVVAAGRPGLRDRVAFVFSFGGHADLPRVLRYACTGVEPQPMDNLRRFFGAEYGQPPPPHDYGVVVLLFTMADRLVPPPQVKPLREAVRQFLWASYVDRSDAQQAATEFRAVRELERTLPEPSRTLLRYVNERDVVHLGARLLPFVDFYGQAPALSVERSPKPSAPVFLMHGIGDNVIPAAEAVHMAEALREHAPVRVLLTRLVSHAELDAPPGTAEVLRLAGFWGDLLAR
jgi:dienelactone hydrolase